MLSPLLTVTFDAHDPARVGDDEIYAVISYFDYHQPASRKSFRTGIVRGDFAPIIGDGTPQCVALC